MNANDPGALGAHGAGDHACVDVHPPITPPASCAIEAAREYLQRGWSILPVPGGSKVAVLPGWPDFRAEAGDLPRLFGTGANVAVILGPRSGELVDVDLDCPEALALADLYLPSTAAIFGRPAKPRSHRLYIAPSAAYESFPDPVGGDTLVELRAAGRDGGAHQTLFPPSIADGERREWSGDTIAAAVVDAASLRVAVAWLAIGALVMRHVSLHAARQPGPDLPALLWEAEPILGRRAHDWLGRPHPDIPRRYPRSRSEMSADDLDLAEMVAVIPNNCDWHEWNAIGLATFAASGGSELGYVVFDAFSARSPKYQSHAVIERWRNYRRSPPNRTGIGKLITLALAAGWHSPKHRAAWS
jgi:Bifunctional DNA primase/polymerase, N-terminal/Primase C terminal 2 (PriCT-2)